MKISKLFHWLYACLMLMPIFAIGVKCLYIIFNPNAKDSWSGGQELTYYEKQETLMPSSLDNGNLIFDNYYKLNGQIDITQWEDDIGGTYNIFELTLIEGTILVNFDSYYVDDSNMYSITNPNETFITLTINIEIGNSPYILIGINIGENYVMEFLEDVTDIECNNLIVRLDNLDTDGLQWPNAIQNFNTTEYYTTNYVENTITETSLDNVFYYAIDDINNQPIFAWANDSFLSEPITYIGALFGVQSGSAIYTLLSYWLSISIIWLTFDLLMYIPLLAHRWIDKGILE